MRELAQDLFAFFAHLGGFGLLAMGVLDSSVLFMPLGNDLLIIGMASRHHELVPYYAAMATAGSVLGCLLMDAISRKGGEAGLEKNVSRRRLAFVKRRVKKNAGWALAFAAIMPPPFPFTVFVIAAAALDYPRKKLLAVIAASRFVRFSLIGLLAILFGRRILRWAESPAVQYGILLLVFISIAGSAISIVRWIRRSKAAAPSRHQLDAAN